ncbi:Alpha/Beta hydrolase protein [Halenospora varia]|nr:Alpha/Beta hydrolase protein [Halenospora varia]
MMSVSIKKAYFDTPSGQIHYRYIVPAPDTSKREMPCVFLHMSATSSQHYEKMLVLYAERGYSVWAPDMPGFGNSYDPETKPENTRWYIDIFWKFFEGVGLVAPGKKFHAFGHHSGAALACEMAVIYPQYIESVCLAGPAIMTRDQQLTMFAKLNKPFNEPKPDGSHLLATWNFIKGTGDDLAYRHQEVLAHIRAWKGRLEIYSCVFNQDFWGLFESIDLGAWAKEKGVG